MKVFKNLTLIIAITFMAGCAKDETFTDQSLLKSDSSTKTEFKLGNKLENAYSVENMKRAYDALMEEGKISKPISINTTHLYIKLTPKDSAEMNCILEDTVLELFPYPLDYELIGEGEYVVDDNATPELYTVIPADHKLDTKITFEKLEDCFIPDNYDENPELADLEIKALLLTNNITEEQLEEENNAKGLSWKYPKGYVKVWNTDEDNPHYEAVRGIKVRIHNIVKLTEIYTNGNGYYSSDRAFLTNVHYSAVFRNRKGFKIWSNLGPFSPAVHNVGWHSKNGYDITIGANSFAWPWATINNATLDYYDKICPHFGINKPYNELRIWYLSGLLGGIMDGEWGGSAPMLRNLTLNTITLTEILTVLGIMPTPSYAITKPLIYGIMLCLPDVFIAEIDTPNTNSLRRLIFHELSHASHYDQVGPAYWVQYMSEICYNYFNDSSYYGSTQNDHNGVIGVGEMWASYFAYQCTEKYYNYGIGLLQTNRWYAPQILKQIEENANNITPEKIYDALVYRVQSHDDLKQELIRRYGQSQVINQAFENEGF